MTTKQPTEDTQIDELLYAVANFYSNRNFSLDGGDYEGVEEAKAKIQRLLLEVRTKSIQKTLEFLATYDPMYGKPDDGEDPNLHININADFYWGDVKKEILSRLSQPTRSSDE